VEKVVKRTLETPLAYIRTVASQTSIDYLDADYGNPLYRKLSEPFYMSFLLEAKNDIENSLLKITNIPGLVINSVNISNFSINSLDVEVNYTYENQVTTSQLSLSL
jgi:hypothetical protein